MCLVIVNFIVNNDFDILTCIDKTKPFQNDMHDPPYPMFLDISKALSTLIQYIYTALEKSSKYMFPM